MKVEIKYVYLLLCVFGIVLPYSQLLPYLLESGFDLNEVFDLLFVNRISALFALDLLVTASTFMVFLVVERRRLYLRHMWIPFIATFLVGASLGFPLLLFIRESALEKKGVG